jgi:uncharacterized protein with HEPN domain
MLKSISQIEQVASRTNYEDFCKDFVLYNSVVRDLEIIGEACKFLPSALTSFFPAMAWQDIKDMRNYITHEYFGVNLAIVWRTANDELPPLKEVLVEMEARRKALGLE